MSEREDRLRAFGESRRAQGAERIEGHVQPCFLVWCRRAACDNDTAAGRARVVGVKRRRRAAKAAGRS